MLFSISTLQRLFGFSAELDSSVPPNKRMQQPARLVFKRKDIALMRWDGSSNGLHCLARRLSTPQLMGPAVRQPLPWAGSVAG